MKKKLFTLFTLLLCLVSNGAWGDDVIFSLTDIVTTTHTVSGGGGEYTLTGSDATITGGTVLLHNGHNNDKEMLNSQINLGGSGNSYMLVTLSGDNTIQIGDIINFGKGGLGYISGTTTKGSEVSIESTGYVVPEGSSLVGKNTIYYWKSSNTGGLSTFTTLTITHPTGTQAPNISFSGTTVTLTCATDGATIYYTIDGSTPTTSSPSKTTGQTFEISNSCTVRAFAQKDEDASSIVEIDCYVSHEDALAVLRYSDGSLDGDSKVWTSSDNKYTMTISTNTFSWTALASTQDGFKLNHVDSYELTTPSDVKITKIAVVGKSWNEGYTAAMSIDDFSPASQSFIKYETGGEKYLKTVEFTPTSTIGYGKTITLRPSGCQLGAYIELYGVVTTSPSDPVAKETKTQTVTFTKSPKTTTCTDADILTMTGGGYKDSSYDGFNGAMELSSDAAITINLPTGATNASVTLLGTNASTTLKLNSSTKTSVSWSGNDTDGYTLTIPIADSNAGNTYTITKGDGASKIHKITLTYMIGSDDKITLTTTNNMDGWRTFYDASQGYTLDANTKAYVASGKGTGTVTLTTIDAVPSGTPVVLKTSAANHQVTLTKATPDAYTGTNYLKVTTGGEAVDAYRMGYNSTDGVAFYPYAVASAPAGVIYLDLPYTARALTFEFDDNTTAIEAVKAQNAAKGEYFNLAGQRVAQPTKGLYIVNGKKVIIK